MNIRGDETLPSGLPNTSQTRKAVFAETAQFTITRERLWLDGEAFAMLWSIGPLVLASIWNGAGAEVPSAAVLCTDWFGWKHACEGFFSQLAGEAQ